MPDTIETLATDTRYIRQSVDELKMQAKATNGRVKSLEMWKAFITGGLAVISTLLVPIAFKVLL